MRPRGRPDEPRLDVGGDPRVAIGAPARSPAAEVARPRRWPCGGGAFARSPASASRAWCRGPRCGGRAGLPDTEAQAARAHLRAEVGVRAGEGRGSTGSPDRLGAGATPHELHDGGSGLGSSAPSSASHRAGAPGRVLSPRQTSATGTAMGRASCLRRAPRQREGVPVRAGVLLGARSRPRRRKKRRTVRSSSSRANRSGQALRVSPLPASGSGTLWPAPCASSGTRRAGARAT